MTHDHRTMAHGDMPCHCAIFRIAEHGTFLATRHAAQGIRAIIEARGHPLVVLDFTGVEAITGAFADELLGTLLADPGVRYEGANTDVHCTLQQVIARRATPMPRS